METIKALLILLSLVATASAVIACLAICNRKRRQQTQPKVVYEKEPAELTGQSIAIPGPKPAALKDAEAVLRVETPALSEGEAQPRAIERPQLSGVGETQPTALDEAELTRAQGAQPIAEKATWPTEQEIQMTVPAEAQPTTVVETPPMGAEKAQRIATQQTELEAQELAQPQEAKKVQSKRSDEPGIVGKRGGREPIKRGGKPRGPTQGLEKEQMQKTKSRRLKPEIVCWKRERWWVPAVEVPEELLENPGLIVLQNGSPLPPDEPEGLRWRLEQVRGEVTVRWNQADAVQEAKVGLGQEDYLLFKLSGKNLDQGRLVKSPSSGSYLVIAPDTWERDETSAGPAPVMPEQVSFAGFKAHFFELDKRGDQKIAFRLSDGQPLAIKANAPRFEVIGRQLTDASEHMGPLFGDGPPRIRALNAEAWKNVETIVVGEEGSSRGRWRTAFGPDPGQEEQDLPSEVAARKSGWYFLRFYDTNDDLLESLDFRFITDLKEIKLPVLRPFPPKDGHKPVRVELLHPKGCVVRSADDSTNIQIELKEDRTILTVPPDPTCDLSRWLVSHQSGTPVEVVLLVERIWWALGDVDNAPSQWTDRPIELSRRDFAATSGKALWLRLPRFRWVDKVLAGFERSKARPYNVRVTEKTIAVPLRDYSDSQEINNQTQGYSFRVWIERDVRPDEGILADLPASPPSPPTQTWVGFGRKKTAIAKAVIQNGCGELKINGQSVDDYFRQTPSKAKQFLERLLELKEVRETLSQVEVNITVKGSSPTTMRQPKAVAHAISRALMNYEPHLGPLLRQAGFGGVKVRSSEISRRGKR